MDPTVEPMEIPDPSAGEGELTRSSKRAKTGPGPGPDLKRVAEIVLVLSTMARMRGGGKSPTAAEMELMAEARTKLAEACACFAPKDLIGREAIGSVMEDLGLNAKLRDQRLGFRGPPKFTIKEKLDNAKRKVLLQILHLCFLYRTYWDFQLKENLGIYLNILGTKTI